jgi:hypothetical protein
MRKWEKKDTTKNQYKLVSDENTAVKGTIKGKVKDEANCKTWSWEHAH